MAKKQIKVTERLLKDGNVHYYTSGRRLTPDQKKDYFKSQIDSASFEPSRLSADDRKLVGRIKGGIAAAGNAYRLGSGQIVKRDISKAAKKLGVDLDAGLKATGFKTIKELEEKKPEFFAAINEYLSSGNVASWYSVKNAKDSVSDYRGKDIYLNGEKVSRSTARAAISAFNQQTLHKLGSDAYKVTIKLIVNGMDRLEINLPDLEELDDEITVAEFNEMFAEFIKVYGSPTPSK